MFWTDKCRGYLFHMRYAVNSNVLHNKVECSHMLAIPNLYSDRGIQGRFTTIRTYRNSLILFPAGGLHLMRCFRFWYLKRSAALGSVSESMRVSLVALVPVTYIPSLITCFIWDHFVFPLQNELKITVFTVALAENEFSSSSL